MCSPCEPHSLIMIDAGTMCEVDRRVKPRYDPATPAVPGSWVPRPHPPATLPTGSSWQCPVWSNISHLSCNPSPVACVYVSDEPGHISQCRGPWLHKPYRSTACAPPLKRHSQVAAVSAGGPTTCRGVRHLPRQSCAVAVTGTPSHAGCAKGEAQGHTGHMLILLQDVASSTALLRTAAMPACSHCADSRCLPRAGSSTAVSSRCAD